MPPKLSIWSRYFREFSPEETVDCFLQHGITAAELSIEDSRRLAERDPDVVKTGKAFKAYLQERGFEITQGHLYRTMICTEPDALDLLERWIRLYDAIGIQNAVFHCDHLAESGLSHRERLDKNAEMLKRLSDRIQDTNVTVCVENMHSRTLDRVATTIDEILYLLDRLDSDRFGVCLDTSHLNLEPDNDPVRFIRAAGSKLRALHVGDNDGSTDQHLMPFGRGTIDFAAVVGALREVGYKGLFNLEIPGECKNVPLEMRCEKLKFIRAAYDYLMRDWK